MSAVLCWQSAPSRGLRGDRTCSRIPFGGGAALPSQPLVTPVHQGTIKLTKPVTEGCRVTAAAGQMAWPCSVLPGCPGPGPLQLPTLQHQRLRSRGASAPLSRFAAQVGFWREPGLGVVTNKNRSLTVLIFKICIPLLVKFERKGGRIGEGGRGREEWGFCVGHSPGAQSRKGRARLQTGAEPGLPPGGWDLSS